MPDLSARRVLRRMLGARTGDAPDAGVAAAATGARAVALLESLISDAAGLGAGFPADAAARAFAAEAAAGDLNFLDRPLAALDGAGARAGLSTAVGMALGGLRATAFLSGGDLAGALDVLADAVARRVPLVVHLAARDAAGGTHGAYHAAAASGAVLLFAASAQEAVDLALVGRRLAEEALTPVVVAQDPEAALAVQDVVLPSRALVARLLGSPSDTVHAATPAQEMLFGRHRRRLPAWHDAARPAAHGTLLPPAAAAAGDAARRAYLDGSTPAMLQAAVDAVAEATGRRLDPLRLHRADGARALLVVEGAAVETATAVADRLRGGTLLGGAKLGVVGVRALRPFPADRLAELLRGRAAVAVLERCDAPLDGEGPLAREVRSVLSRRREAGERDLPRLTTALYGLGGSGLRAADLERLGRELLGDPAALPPGPRYLGIDLAPAADGRPKRQVVADALRRAAPEAAALGLRASGPVPGGLLPPGAFTLAFERRAGGAGDGVAAAAASLLHRTAGGHLRGRTAVSWERWGGTLTDRVTWSPAPLVDPGDDVLADLGVCLCPSEPPRAEVVRGLARGGVLLFERPEEGWRRAPAMAFVRAAEEQAVKLFALPAYGEPELRREHLLGALAGVLTATGRVELKPRRLAEARRQVLVARGLGAAEVERRLAALAAGRDRVHELTRAEIVALVPAGEVADGDEPEVPEAARRLLSGAGGAFAGSELGRLWDRMAEAEPGAPPLPEPHLAARSQPAAAAALASTATGRTLLPVFDPGACTGCGDCWTVCPDGAVGPAVLGAAALLDRGMALAAARGRSADALRRISGKLVAALHRQAAAAEGATTAGELFAAAWPGVVDRTPVGDEVKLALRAACSAVQEAIAELPVARTAAFFDDPEAAAAGSGELFTLAIDPDACKGCGLCIEACSPGALTAGRDDVRRSRRERALWRLVEELPAPAAETVERARRHPEVGPLAGALLTPEARRTLVGAGPGEAGSGDALALRQALGAVAFHLAPRRRALLDRIDGLAAELAEAIQAGMARALPGRDLASLSQGLAALELPEADLAELASRVETAFESERVDVPRLRHLVDAARGLADLRWRLTAGEAGQDRALYGVVAGPGPAAAWAGAFPGNPFTVPVTVTAGGDAAALARGVAEAALHAAVDGARALRRARLELEAKGGPAAEGRVAEELDRLRHLSWRELSADERALCPPLVLVASEDALAATSLPGLAALVDDELPVKVLLLSAAHLGIAEELPDGRPDDPSAWAPSAGAGLGAVLLGRRAFAAQCSPGHPDHLEAAVAAALEHDGPAVVRVHAPSPERHGFAPAAGRQRARSAVAARVWPLWTSAAPDADPSERRFDLAGNPEAGDLSVADWALGEARYAAHLPPLDGRRPGPLPLAEWLALAAPERTGHTPTLEGPDGAAREVSAPLARAAAERGAAWRALEARSAATSGAAEPAAKPVTEAASERRHQAELGALRAAYEAQIADLERRMQTEMARKVRGKLLALAARRPVAAGGAADGGAEVPGR